MQRVKLTCFDVSNKYIAFGASSGGVYIFQKKPCIFSKFIPSNEGSATLISISPDENHLAVATSIGLILVIDSFITYSDIQHKVYREHENYKITCLKWHGNDLYSGDANGKIAVLSIANAVKKVIFQLPSASLMLLDSSIVQIDTYLNFLLVSTETRSYVCDVEREHYKPIGRKLRNGCYGACFIGPKSNLNQYEFGEKVRGTFKTIDDNETLSINKNNDCIIYCARPGVRLWQANFQGTVEVTYQLKGCLEGKPRDILQIDNDVEARLVKDVVSGKQTVPNNFNLQKIFSFGEKYIVTHFLNGLYVLDPALNQLVLLMYFGNDVRDVVVNNLSVYIWEQNLQLTVISMTHLENLVLSTLYKKQYYLCAEICVNYLKDILELIENSKKLYLISILKSKIKDDVLLRDLDSIFIALNDKNQKEEKLQNPTIYDYSVETDSNIEIEEFEVTPDKNTNNLNIILKQYMVSKNYNNLEIPDYVSLLNNLTLDDILALFREFIEYHYNENAILWCGNQFLNQVSSKNTDLKKIGVECLNYLIDSLFRENKDLSYSCCCGFPLPKCHNFTPKYYGICKDMLNVLDNIELLMKNIPYMLKHTIHTENGINIPLITQFSDLELFQKHLICFTYDTWDAVISLFIKLNQGLCLNCDKNIEVEGIFSWTELGLTIIQSIGTNNTLKIFTRYSQSIPNGALEMKFYQACIFVSSFDTKTTGPITRRAINLLNGLNKKSYKKLQTSLERHLNKKYMGNDALFITNSSFEHVCQYCQLPLKNAILSNKSEESDNRCHTLCFKAN
ncbi:BLOC-2 complex member HPS5 homolog isoform X2 [Cylas formicarius]|nr:BLOC-2 complex member HPS5 homolog isoform X2 [Cylas formicarius]